jgi:hypothetical protein
MKRLPTFIFAAALVLATLTAPAASAAPAALQPATWAPSWLQAVVGWIELVSPTYHRAGAASESDTSTGGSGQTADNGAELDPHG